MFFKKTFLDSLDMATVQSRLCGLRTGIWVVVRANVRDPVCLPCRTRSTAGVLRAQLGGGVGSYMTPKGCPK